MMMYEHNEDFVKNEFRGKGTGSPDIAEEYKDVTCPFGKYEITVRLTLSNEFIGIADVRINKDFLSHKQKMVSKGFHDVDEFYRE